MRPVLKRARFLATLLGLALLTPLGPANLSATPDPLKKLDPALKGRARKSHGYSRVIVRTGTANAGNAVDALIRGAGGMSGRKLPSTSSQVAVVPNAALRGLAASPIVERVSLDRRVVGAMERTGLTIGAVAVRQSLGVDGAGVGVAVIDSGIASWHDDLSVDGVGQRVREFVDFVDGVTTPHDDYGHGTHVAGIIAGNGRDSDGARTGIAPGAHLVVLRVLDERGRGHISDVIAAIDYAVAQREALNIRVINLSIAAAVYESYETDPLTLAAERAVRAGITVVAAAGNNGRSLQGNTQYGGIASPGNAPWVLTVGASSHMGTPDRADDTIAAFTSRGPTGLDHRAKPDIVAPGVGIESLSAPGSTLYSSAAALSALWSDGNVTAPVPQPQRHERLRFRRERDGCADAASEPIAHAECRQGDPAVHLGSLPRLRPIDRGRRIRQREGRGRAREIPGRCLHQRVSRRVALGRDPHLGQPARQRRPPHPGRQRVVGRRDVGGRSIRGRATDLVGHALWVRKLRHDSIQVASRRRLRQQRRLGIDLQGREL